MMLWLTYRHWLLFALACMPVSSVSYGDEEPAAKRAALIAAQMHNDMFYGSDDYFGDHRDLAYADRVVPGDSAAKKRAVATKAAPTQTSPAKSKVSDRKSRSTDAGGTSGDDGGSDDDTPAVPPGGDPDPGDDPADDIGDDISDDVGDDIGDDAGGGG